MNGYFGTLEHFKFKSLHTSFRKGIGLPEMDWKRNMPIIMDDLSKSHRFIRSEGAVETGITTRLGIPVFYFKDHVYLMAFLSARGTPITRQIEIWLPDINREI